MISLHATKAFYLLFEHSVIIVYPWLFSLLQFLKYSIHTLLSDALYESKLLWFTKQTSVISLHATKASLFALWTYCEYRLLSLIVFSSLKHSIHTVLTNALYGSKCVHIRVRYNLIIFLSWVLSLLHVLTPNAFNSVAAYEILSALI